MNELIVPTDRSKHQDAALKGKAVEHLVAASCILMSDLELNVSTSFVDDEGVDLVFHRRGCPTTLAIQVKSRYQSASTSQKGRFLADIRTQTFSPRPDLYLMFVCVLEDIGDYGPVWFVPSQVLAARCTPNSLGRLRFAASMNAKSNDQWTNWKCPKAELAHRIVDRLKELEAP